jgi:hypothetical protein
VRECDINGTSELPLLKLQELFNDFPKSERTLILREAGQEEHSFAGDIDVRFGPERIIAAILRRISVSNEEFAFLLSEAGVNWDRYSIPLGAPIWVAFAYGPAKDMVLTDVTASTVVLWEVSVRVAAVLDALSLKPQPLDPPVVHSVEPGSTTVSLGGGPLLVSGVGFLIAAASHMPPQATVPMYVGGAFLASLGILEFVANWRRTIKEAAKLDSETQLNRIKATETQKAIDAPAAPLPPPASLVPPQDFVTYTQQLQVPLPLAVHLINTVSPAVRDLLNAAGNPVMTVQSGGKAHRATTSASA